ncbi:MAG TPA: hypothetical protein DCQ92_14735, partial [Verrucomicrobia subdivision 3 bacterium]|nr:hypothetical protein [Limisphaerales bacterium]
MNIYLLEKFRARNGFYRSWLAFTLIELLVVIAI